MEKYAKDNGFKNIRHFTDDGYTGTNFKRPAWQELIELVGGCIFLIAATSLEMISCSERE